MIYLKSNNAAVIDAMIPLVIPRDGITRSELARKLRVSYSEATRALERLHQHRLLSRRIRKSHYVYRLTGSRQSLTISTLNTIFLN